MEPFDDRELNDLLREWQAPGAPLSLWHRLRGGGHLGARRGGPLGPPVPWWRWLFAGSIRVPVPVAIGVALLLAMWSYAQLPATAPLAPQEPTVSLADFEPVRQLEPRVVGEFK